MDIFFALTNTEDTNTDTRQEAAHHHVYPRLHCGDLNDVSKDEDDHTKGQVPSTAPPVRRVCTEESTKERANAHERDENRRSGCSDRISSCRVWVRFAEASKEVFENKNATDLALSSNRQLD